MKQLNAIQLALTSMLLSSTAWSQVPVLKSDLEAGAILVNAGIGDLSITQDFDNGVDSEILDYSATLKEVGLTFSGPESASAIPVIAVDIEKLSTDQDSEDNTGIDIHAGLLMGEDRKHLFVFNYETNSEDAVRGGFGFMGVFRGAQGAESKGAYEISASADFNESTDEVSGGHDFSIGASSKLPLAGGQVFLTSSVAMGFQTQVNYVSGTYRKAKPSLAASLGLHIQPSANVAFEMGLSTYMQSFEYYLEDGEYVLSESRTGLGFGAELTVAL